ncbi:MAG: helix-turn-helix domain-containing protein, partial [Spirochaetaceae bacterium]
CFQCGFVSHSHFTSTFHRCSGMTPSEYRRSIANSP